MEPVLVSRKQGQRQLARGSSFPKTSLTGAGSWCACVPGTQTKSVRVAGGAPVFYSPLPGQSPQLAQPSGPPRGVGLWGVNPGPPGYGNLGATSLSSGASSGRWGSQERYLPGGSDGWRCT